MGVQMDRMEAARDREQPIIDRTSSMSRGEVERLIVQVIRRTLGNLEAEVRGGYPLEAALKFVGRDDGRIERIVSEELGKVLRR